MLSTILAIAIVSSYAGVVLLSIKNLTEAPAFESKKNSFDLRINYGTHVRLISCKPAPVKWEQPEAYFPVATERRVQTTLGYRVELMATH